MNVPLSAKMVVLRALEHRAENNRQAIQNNIAEVQDVYRTFEDIRIASYKLSHDFSKSCYSIRFEPYISKIQQLTKVNDILKSVITEIKNSIIWHKEKKKARQKYKRDKTPIDYSKEY